MTGALLILVPILIAPVVMYAALRAQRRLGSEAAGWIAAIPTTVPIAVLAVGLQNGDQSASTLTLSAASHVPAQICFAICFAAGMKRYGIARGFALGAAAFVGVSLLIAYVPIPVAIAAAIVALAVGPRLLSSPVEPELVEAEQSGPNALLACSAAAVVVAAVMAVVRVGGPVIGGVVAAFPTLSSTIAIAIARSNGRNAAIGALAGLIRGLPFYFAYLVTVAALAVQVGIVGATVAGLAVSAATGWGLWLIRRDRLRPIVEI